MKKYGILAYPAGHSKSPEMHTAAFQYFGISASYDRYEISPEKLREFLNDHFRISKVLDGLSVSIPHKETIIPFLDGIESEAEKIGAVNTVFWKGDLLFGTNTDYSGFSRALREEYEVEGKRALVIGAGGASRAVIVALLRDHAECITVSGRTPEKAKHLADHFQVRCQVLEELSPDDFDLIINATPLGTKGEFQLNSPVPDDFWQSHHTAFDLVYNPEKTRFLKEAFSHGATAISGKSMFIFQGMEQFRIWTGKEPPKEVMEGALQYPVNLNEK